MGIFNPVEDFMHYIMFAKIDSPCACMCLCLQGKAVGRAMMNRVLCSEPHDITDINVFSAAANGLPTTVWHIRLDESSELTTLNDGTKKSFLQLCRIRF